MNHVNFGVMFTLIKKVEHLSMNQLIHYHVIEGGAKQPVAQNSPNLKSPAEEILSPDQKT